MTARLETTAEGCFRLSGDLTFKSVPAIWRAGLETLISAPKIEIDLKGIRRSDSAGLALLIEWQRLATRANKSVSYLNMPAQMLAIARASSLDQILPLSRS